MDMSMSDIDMSTTTMPGMSISVTMSMSAALTTTTDFTPGRIDSKGDYVPTSAERTAYQAAHIPWAQQVRYGHYTLGFLCGMVGLFAVVRLFWAARIRYNARIPVYTRIAACLRLVSYPRLSPNPWIDALWTLGPLGPNVILLGGLLFASCFTWINEYYYYPPFYGSAPLYLRSEWIAMATLPFIFVLGAKRSLMSLLTGVSHEKLQVLHQGAAFNFVYMSLVHTIAAIIRAYRDYGFPSELKYNAIYVSGFVALAPLLVLSLGALPIFRNVAYEVFYYVHIVMALFFLGGMFWHGYDELDSNKYMIGTIVIFLFGVAWRMVAMAMDNPALHRATATIVGERTIRLVIPSTTIRAGAGQHVFIRFLSVRPFESHPFSISAIAEESRIDKAARVELDIIVRVRSGFTRALFDVVSDSRNGTAELAVLLDGPYGGVGEDLRAFDEVLVCCGGSGMSWGLGCLQEVLRTRAEGEERMKKVRLVWAVSEPNDLVWFNSRLSELQREHPYMDIQLFVTGHGPDVTEDNVAQDSRADDKDEPCTANPLLQLHKEGDSKTAGPASKHNQAYSYIAGRPDLPSFISSHIAQTQGSLAVACCGPAGFTADCANAVAKAQLLLIRNELPEVTEIFLKSESYGW